MLAERPLLTALALSLAVHLSLLATTGRLWNAMPEEIGFPIEASLAPLSNAPDTPEPVLRPAPQAAIPVSPPSHPTSPEPAEAPPSPAPTMAEPTPSEPVAQPAPAIIAPPQASPVAVAPVVEATPESKMDARSEPIRPARPALRILPAHVDIRYAVQYGDGGFTAGEARYTWRSQAGRYSLTSSVEAKGLASLFINGRITQTSEGTVEEGGLKPEQYASQQSDRRQDTARFLWDQNQVQLSGARGSVPLVPQAQDLLSFPFQLAATARAGEPEFNLAVSNGRKLQQYRFRVVGEERLSLPGRVVDTLHLQGGRESTGTLDVWLDQNTMHLPVQVRTLDGKGKQVTLIAEDVAIK